MKKYIRYLIMSSLVLFFREVNSIEVFTNFLKNEVVLNYFNNGIFEKSFSDFYDTDLATFF